MEEKNEIGSLHNEKNFEKKIEQTKKKLKKVIHIEKCRKTDKNRVINRVIHVIHKIKLKKMWFTYFWGKQMFCLFLIKI